MEKFQQKTKLYSETKTISIKFKEPTLITIGTINKPIETS